MWETEYGNFGDIVFIKSNNDWDVKAQQPRYRNMWAP